MNSTVRKFLTVIIICIVVLELIGGSVFLAAYFSHKNPKKAVIILPGLFASGLYNTANGEGVWDPFDEIDVWFSDITARTGLPIGVILQIFSNQAFSSELDKLFDNNCRGASDSLFNLMAMNEDGTPAVETIKPVPFDSDSRLRYGVVNAQKEMYDTLYEQYGTAYEVMVYNYDFRLDNRYSAEKLEEFINEKGYKEVILVSHSNGGAVASCYLGRSKENRDKVSLYLSYDAPYYGSFAAIGTLEDIDGMIAGVLKAIKDIPILEGLGNAINDVFQYQFKKLVNLWAVYQLLPSYELLTTQQYRHIYTEQIMGIEGKPEKPVTKVVQDAMYNIDGEDIIFESKEELWEFYCSRPWAKMSNGQLKPQMAQWLDFQDAMMVELEDGRKVHSTSLVNTQYFSGMGYNNVTKLYFKTEDGNLVRLPQNDFTDQGDGTVLLYSSTAGCTENHRIHIIPDANHYDVAQRFNTYTKDMTIAIVNKEISAWNKFVIKLFK